MASKGHVDNTVNERRLRPIYGTYTGVDDDLTSSPLRTLPPDRFGRDSGTGDEVI